MFETLEQMNGRTLGPREAFRFQCSPGLACFNSCCRDKRLPLWPYDMLRLRQGLDLPSHEILANYVDLEFDPRTGWPALRLRLDQKGRCPLLGPQGCRSYEHRPAACRIYPLSWAFNPLAQGEGEKELFQVIETKNCLGWDQDREHTVATWVDDQGLEPYLKTNAAMAALWFNPARTGRLKLNEPQVHAVIAALYNLDLFRLQIQSPGFAGKAGFKKACLEKALEDDLELLAIGRDWLNKQLFGG